MYVGSCRYQSRTRRSRCFLKHRTWQNTNAGKDEVRACQAMWSGSVGHAISRDRQVTCPGGEFASPERFWKWRQRALLLGCAEGSMSTSVGVLGRYKHLL
jgi:hypothetical protein